MSALVVVLVLALVGVPGVSVAVFIITNDGEDIEYVSVVYHRFKRHTRLSIRTTGWKTIPTILVGKISNQCNNVPMF